MLLSAHSQPHFRRMTTIAGDAFTYSFKLHELILSDNDLSFIPALLTENLPALQRLSAANNQILIIPRTSNHIADPLDFVGNPLQCDHYGPQTSLCTCPANFTVDTRFGYTQCTPVSTPNGCPLNTFFNVSDTSATPWSVCVADVPKGLYYNHEEQVFLRVTECNTAFRKFGTLDEYLSAYQVRPSRGWRAASETHASPLTVLGRL